MTDIKKLLHFIEQAGMLLQMPRSHKRSLITSFDNIASHSYHVCVLSYCLSRTEGLSVRDSENAVVMALFHDLEEARTGDLDFISKNYTKTDEEKAINHQFSKLHFGKELVELLNEYIEGKSKVSQCVRDADSLAQIYHEWVLMWQGNKLAEQWFKADFIERIPHLFTNTAKELVNAMKSSNPNEWWWNELVEKGGRVKTKEHLLGKNYK
ncbi:MAG: HD domain-containing protein [Patescibacteria group bacterium]